MDRELKHLYGGNYHVLNDPFLSSLLALLSSKETKQPLITDLVKHLYKALLSYAIAEEFPRKCRVIPTRMDQFHKKEALLKDDWIDFDTKIVIVNLARAGIVPSQFCYEFLTHIFKPDHVRQDYIYIQRTVDEKGAVIGSVISGYKIGGSIDNAIVLFSDPMGATGGSISATLDLYKEKIKGVPLKYLALHLILTPEYLKRLETDHPELIVYGLRLDRGLSSQKIINTIPGTHWDKERGLNNHQYIVPGAGGLGELLSNSFV